MATRTSLWDDFVLRLRVSGTEMSDIQHCSPSILQNLLLELGFSSLQAAKLQTEWSSRFGTLNNTLSSPPLHSLSSSSFHPFPSSGTGVLGVRSSSFSEGAPRTDNLNHQYNNNNNTDTVAERTIRKNGMEIHSRGTGTRPSLAHPPSSGSRSFGGCSSSFLLKKEEAAHSFVDLSGSTRLKNSSSRDPHCTSTPSSSSSFSGKKKISTEPTSAVRVSVSEISEEFNDVAGRATEFLTQAIQGCTAAAPTGESIRDRKQAAAAAACMGQTPRILGIESICNPSLETQFTSHAQLSDRLFLPPPRNQHAHTSLPLTSSAVQTWKLIWAGECEKVCREGFREGETFSSVGVDRSWFPFVDSPEVEGAGGGLVVHTNGVTSVFSPSSFPTMTAEKAMNSNITRSGSDVLQGQSARSYRDSRSSSYYSMPMMSMMQNASDPEEEREEICTGLLEGQFKLFLCDAFTGSSRIVLPEDIFSLMQQVHVENSSHTVLNGEENGSTTSASDGSGENNARSKNSKKKNKNSKGLQAMLEEDGYDSLEIRFPSRFITKGVMEDYNNTSAAGASTAGWAQRRTASNADSSALIDGPFIVANPALVIPRYCITFAFGHPSSSSQQQSLANSTQQRPCLSASSSSSLLKAPNNRCFCEERQQHKNSGNDILESSEGKSLLEKEENPSSSSSSSLAALHNTRCCPRHNGKTYEFWCTEEKKLLCSYCMFRDGYSQKSSVMLLEDALRAERPFVEKWVDHADQFLQEMGTVMEMFEASMEEVTQKEKEENDRLIEALEVLKGQLNKKIETVQDALSQHTKQSTHRLQQSLTKVVGVCSQVEDTAAQSRRALKRMDTLGILLSRIQTSSVHRRWEKIELEPPVLRQAVLSSDQKSEFERFLNEFITLEDVSLAVELPAEIDVNRLSEAAEGEKEEGEVVYE